LGPVTEKGRSVAYLRALWVAILAAPSLTILLLLASNPAAGTPRPTLLFWIVVVAASLCVVASLLVLQRAWRRNERELGYLAVFFLTASCLPLLHGLTTPGVVFGPNEATMSSVFWTIPTAALLSLPAVMGNHELRSRIDAHWQTWCLWAIGVIVTICAMLVIQTDLLPSPEPATWWTRAIVGASLGACALWAYRHLELAIISRSSGPLMIAAAYGLVGSSALIWLGGEPYSVAFWAVHLFDIVGVFMGTIGALIVYVRTDDVRDRLHPILVVDTRAALELGLDPLVREFIRDLEAKDSITRDHVVRTTELAMSISRKLGHSPQVQREVGLTALLHDVGKLVIPDDLLTKPGPLTDREYAIMKRHPNYGADMLLSSPALASIAPAVRAHHERIDGKGYPRGLYGSQIPVAARVVAVCDGYDAMANSRQYRQGLSVETVIETLERNAGLQWDRRVVEAVVRHVRHSPPDHMPRVLDAIGRIGCDCLPHPDEVATDVRPLYGARDGYATDNAKAS